MEHLRTASNSNRGTNGYHENGLGAEDAKAHGLDYELRGVDRTWGGDKRLQLYAYTIETVNLLIIPMIQTK